MNKILNLFKSNATLAQEALDTENKLREKFQEEQDELLKKKETEANLFREEQERIRKEVEDSILQDKLNSQTPWFEPIIGAENATFVHEKYRWNQAQIKDLIKKGHKGQTDSEIFQSYLDQIEYDDRHRIIEEERDKKRNSIEPWVEVIGENIDTDGRIEIQLDWNDAFVKFLRVNGFRGATDDVLVQSWLAALEKDINPEEYH